MKTCLFYLYAHDFVTDAEMKKIDARILKWRIENRFPKPPNPKKRKSVQP